MKEIAKRTGMCDATVEGSEENNFHSFKTPLNYMAVNAGIVDMYSKAIVANVENDLQQQEVEIADGCIIFHERVNDRVVEETVSQTLVRKCREALIRESEIEYSMVKQRHNFNFKILVPPISTEKYKGHVAADLETRGKVSANRLIRVQSTANAQNMPSSVQKTNVVGLADYVAVRSDKDDEYYIAFIKRIYRRYTANNGRSRLLEYVKPFDLSISNFEIIFKVTRSLE